MLILRNRNFLIYGLGLSGRYCLNFLNKSNKVDIYDDFKKNLSTRNKKFFISKKKITKKNYDYIVISPGINIRTCSLKDYLKKNRKKIITDLDIFYYLNQNNIIIAITGTNGKSTTSKLINDILSKNKQDVRLIGNIGNSALGEKNISQKTIFIVEISSYQIEYSKYFKGNISAILNIAPDHLERHLTFKKYLKVKIKLLENQPINSKSFINKQDKIIINFIKKKKIKSKIKKITVNFKKNFLKQIKNPYFRSVDSLTNLKFAIEITKLFNVKNKTIIKTVNSFSNLSYRREIIYNKNKLLIINDSKSTSFSSSVNLLKNYKNIYWILGGISKKGDLLKLNSVFKKKIKAYIYGKDIKFFKDKLKNTFYVKTFKNLKNALEQVIRDTTNDSDHKSIIFSPSAASFDQFKNFEERGKYFNNILKKLNFIKKIIYEK